jgi:hypothetical protein
MPWHNGGTLRLSFGSQVVVIVAVSMAQALVIEGRRSFPGCGGTGRAVRPPLPSGRRCNGMGNDLGPRHGEFGGGDIKYGGQVLHLRTLEYQRRFRPVGVHLPIAVYPADADRSFDINLDALLSRKRKLAADILAAPALTADDEEDAGPRW